MKIAYIINHDPSFNDGIVKKIKSQTDVWRSQGHQVEVHAYTDSEKPSILDCVRYKKNGLVSFRLFQNKRLVANLSHFNPDIIYYRYDTWNRNFGILSRKFPVVLELNTADLDEFRGLVLKEKTLKSLLRYAAYYLLRGAVFRNAKGLVGVTREIIEGKDVRKYSKPSICVPNTIDFSRFPVLKKEVSSVNGLFFIGSPGQHWHGVDIIDKLSLSLSGFHFHIVGEEGLNKENITYHGFLQQKEYLEVLSQCVACFGTLGLFRKNMTEASPLKVREYLAYGYPVIIGYDDSSFEKLPDFILKLDFEKGDIEANAKKIHDFVQRNKNRVVLRKEIGSIDANQQELYRLNFFKSLISTNN